MLPTQNIPSTATVNASTIRSHGSGATGYCLSGDTVRAEAIRASLYGVRTAAPPSNRLGPILFDRAVAVEATVSAPVYDLAIEGTHNFVANDFIVHNSTRCSQAEGR